MSEMSSTEMQKAIKEAVVPFLFDEGISKCETYQIDNYKWLVLVDNVDDEPHFAEISITAKKSDFDYDAANAAIAAYNEKHRKAVEREAARAEKRAEKMNSKNESKNSSGNLEKDYVPYSERYANDDF